MKLRVLRERDREIERERELFGKQEDAMGDSGVGRGV